MTASFAAYASQFLNRQQHPASSVSSSSQPLFFSFTTDNGSRADDDPFNDRTEVELADEDDPHLRQSSELLQRELSSRTDDDDDPYLRLDEDDPRTAHAVSESIPMIASEALSTTRGPVQGWLAHQGAMSYRQPTPTPSESSSESGIPPPDLLSNPATRTIPPPPVTTAGGPLTESLLPRDGRTRPVDNVSLPDPRRHSRRRGSHKDPLWTTVWLASVTACLIGSFIILFTTKAPRGTPRGTILPYTTLLHTIPLITILTFISAIVSYAHIMLLRVFVKPVIFATSVFIPATLFISAIWAFVGSFMWEEGSEPTWGETVGLRLFSIIPLVLAIITSRRLLHLPEEIHTTSSILFLSTNLLISNPFLLALSPLILLLALLLSIPFLTLVFRLLLIGYFTSGAGTAWEWHVKNWAGWSIAGAISVWLWSWGVARGILRTTCAGVIGAWYFHPNEVTEPPPLSTDRIHAALSRASDSSLGSVVLSALLLTIIRILALLTSLLRRAPVPLLPFVAVPINFLGNITGALSPLALVYTGLTGEEFFPSARRAKALTNPSATSKGATRYRRSSIDPSLSILSITPLTLTLPFALSAYLFVAHTLHAPDYAPFASFLAGGITALVGKFCVGLVEDTADTLYMCYSIDKDAGRMNRKEVFQAFEWRSPARQPLPIHQTPLSAADVPSSSDSEPDETIQHPVQFSARRERNASPIRTDSVVDSVNGQEEEEEEGEESMMLGLDFV